MLFFRWKEVVHKWNEGDSDSKLVRECNLHLVSNGGRPAYKGQWRPEWLASVKSTIGCVVWPWFFKSRRLVVWECLYYQLASPRMQKVLNVLQLPGAGRNGALLGVALGYLSPLNNPGEVKDGVQYWISSKTLGGPPAFLYGEKFGTGDVTPAKLELKRAALETCLRTLHPDMHVTLKL